LIVLRVLVVSKLYRNGDAVMRGMNGVVNRMDGCSGKNDEWRRERGREAISDS
jgi:hypothetical protein